MKLRIAFAAATATLALMGGAAHAATPVASLSDLTGETLGNPPFTLGFSFTANSAVLVTQLGVFDGGQDGLAEAHAVGLWDSVGTLLASTVVGAGTSGTLVNQFRYADIPFVALAAGQTYRVGAVWASGADPLVLTASGLSLDPRFSYQGGAYIGGASLANPTSVGGEGGYFGPNLMIGGGVPEPATWAMMIAGFGMVGFALRRRELTPVRVRA
jgi:hypothetical protein